MLEEPLEELELGELGTGIDTVGGVGMLVVGGNAATDKTSKAQQRNGAFFADVVLLWSLDCRFCPQ